MSHSTQQASSTGARRLRPALFAATALCFLLPFGTVSCAGEHKVEVTGVDLVSRTVPQARETPDGPNLAQQVEDGAFVKAVFALVAVILGLVLSTARPQAIGKTLVITLAGIVALLSLPATAILALANVTLGPGFVGVLAIEVLLVILHVALLKHRRRRASSSSVVVLPRGAVPRVTTGGKGAGD